MVTGPLFKWFGSKWLSAKKMPEPVYDLIIEPFGGSAGYSLRHPSKRVVVCENNANLFRLWTWLTEDATTESVLEIPIDIPSGTDIRNVGLTEGQALLLKHWQRTNNVGDCWTISPWGNSPGQWTANTRSRVAEELHEVKHWTIVGDGIEYMANTAGVSATWFVDPIYQFNYTYGQKRPNYELLASCVCALNGQVIVCEAMCPKTGRVPTWLPFERFGARITSRRGDGARKYSDELIYRRGGKAFQGSIFDVTAQNQRVAVRAPAGRGSV